GPRRLAEQRGGGEHDLGGVAGGERDDRPARRDTADRGRERGAADALDDRVEALALGGDLVDDLVGAERLEALRALRARRDRRDVGAAALGQLDREAPDAARRAGDEDAA